MFYKKICGVAAGLLLFCGVASAQTDPTGLYFRSNAFAANVAFDGGLVPDHNPTGVYLTLGNLINKNVAAEFRYGIGIHGDASQVPGLEVKVDNFLGAYIRVGSLTGNAINPYVVAGYTRGRISITLDDVTGDADGSDFSFGLGTDITINEKLFFNAEYMNYYDDDGIQVTGWGIGFTVKH